MQVLYWLQKEKRETWQLNGKVSKFTIGDFKWLDNNNASAPKIRFSKGASNLRQGCWMTIFSKYIVLSVVVDGYVIG